MKTKHSIVISGSFRRHFDGIKKTVEFFELLGVNVISPKASKIINPGEEFAIIETDDTNDKQTLEQRHLDAITNADALYLYDPDGYIDDSSKMELGWAIALGKQVFCKELISDSTLKFFCGEIASPKQVVEKLLNQSLVNTINKRSSVPALQNYIHKMVIKRGFDNEKPQDVFLLLVEEVGELAKAMRKYLGLKTDQNKNKQDKYSKLEDEMADVFIYLLDLANLLKISLFNSLHKKEKENDKRIWK